MLGDQSKNAVSILVTLPRLNRIFRRAAVWLCVVSAVVMAAEVPAPQSLIEQVKLPAVAAPALPVGAAEGLRFRCAPDRLAALAPEIGRLLRASGVRPAQYRQVVDQAAGTLSFVLATPDADFVTLDFYRRAQFGVKAGMVRLPGPHGMRRVRTVSQQEILLALMQHGRLTEFSGSACDVQALRDHVAIRQLIVAWSENLDWTFPDGRPARWNGTWWVKGTPRPQVPVERALRDVFLHQARYSFGCYTAAKIVVTQAVLDYYSRVHPDAGRLALVKARLLADQDPLVDIEPPAMWSFESDFDPRELPRVGKLLQLQHDVPAGNFIPGDWTYLVNPDPASSQRAGYEGSNALYLGQGRFDDFYNDNDHAYSYRQKIDEVYQWQFGVFSRSRDAAKIHPLSDEVLGRLGQTPEHGGLVLAIRAVPYLFGYQALPAWVAPVLQAGN